MEIEIGRAREMARELALGNNEIDTQKRKQLSEQLKMMADLLEVQCQRLEAARHALNYYGDSNLYIDPADPEQQILDGGLRARTALSELDAPIERLRARNRGKPSK